MSARIIFFNLCLAILFASQAKAQIIVSDGTKIQNDTIGEAQILVQYETRCISNTEKPGKCYGRNYDVGESVKISPKFYSYTKYVCDSVLAVDFANKASQETINEHLKQYGTSKLSERTFRGYPAGKVTTLDEIAGISRLRCEEPDERPQWKILAENDSILSYLCGKSRMSVQRTDMDKRRFTSEIPVSEGPWKLCGLPGLILKAVDSEGHYSFTATGVEQCHTDRPILFDGKKHEPMNRKAYNKVHERYYADPVGFITGSMPNVTIKVSDEHGNATKNPKNVPYNPLERGE
ncbi:MAG: GLPGLI family protein [Bacteroides cellulosilyticus]